MSLFETKQIQTNINNDLENIDDCELVYSDNDSNNDSDSDLENKCKTITQNDTATLYVVDCDYVVRNGEYYLNHPTLIKIAIRSGIRRAEQYVDKTWKLVHYINTYGKQAYNSLLKTIEMTPDERREMFSITNTTLEQNRIDQLNKAYQKIEELEAHIDINKTKKTLEKYQKEQKILYNNTLSNDDEVFIVEKQPTKVKPSSILKKATSPIKDNELESFLGL